MGRPWAGRHDSVARTLEVFCDTWTFMVLREAFFGIHRFDDFQRNLEISRNVLTKRLKHLVEQEILERRLYQRRPDRYEYRLSPKGLDMYSTFLTLMQWGDRWLAEDGVPLILHHDACDHVTRPKVVCDHCGQALDAKEMTYAPGPGADPSEEQPTPEPQLVS